MTRSRLQRHWSLSLLLAGSLAPLPRLHGQAAPRNGQEVIERMHSAYAKTWYHNLTFVQTTKIDRPGSDPVEQTWYETMASPGYLRIDIADPDSGNGIIYTRDSAFVVKNGAVARRLGGGNPFLPLILGVYVQETGETLHDLAAYKFDLSKIMTIGSGASTTWVVGTATPGDTTSPQFWVDPQRLVVTRIVSSVGPGILMDAGVGGYVPVGKAWLATQVAISLGNGTRQEESYHDWKADRDLPPGFFDPAQWKTVRHWAHE